MKSVEIDRSKRLRDQPSTGHNRLHPDIPPILEVDAGEDVILETRDAADGELGPTTTAATIAGIDVGAVHPLTGPVFVKGARPGDLLEVEFVDIRPQPHAFSAILPGLGFLRDLFTTPFLVHWRRRRLGDVTASARSANPGRVLHGGLRRGTVPCAARRVDRAREGRRRSRWPGPPP